MKNFIEKDKSLGIDLIVGLLKFWPITNPAKEVVYITEIEEILKVNDQENLSAGSLKKLIEKFKGQVSVLSDQKHEIEQALKEVDKTVAYLEAQL